MGTVTKVSSFWNLPVIRSGAIANRLDLASFHLFAEGRIADAFCGSEVLPKWTQPANGDNDCRPNVHMRNSGLPLDSGSSFIIYA